MDNKKIGLFLQGLRKEKQLTQLELATQLNVTPQSVSKWEKGDSIPDISTLSSLASFYQISIDEVIKGELNSPIIKGNEALENDRLWIISRVTSAVMIFISLFLYYINETISLSGLNPLDDWNPFNINEMKTVVNVRGFDLVFNITKLSIFSVGGWIIFLSLLVLITIFSLELFSILTKQKKNMFIDKDIYLMIKKISEITLSSGFMMVLLGVIFYSSVNISIGYFIGLLFIIGLLTTNYLETKKIL